ncbi:ECF RNA polymerase sigma factor SigW [Caulifigura coniformis]|uniref:ECF RNA polymerase sigma factor SigW n=2 Tax=Caulifigura coniformis TaxID=2527983 RepID=A0A517SGB8_9PLAN|nr:ECF RNA polymerase sigma factor SigW [Caulifigura coniformis]
MHDAASNHDEFGNAPAGAGGPTGRMDEFVRLFSLHQRKLYQFIASLLPDSRDVEDVFQETSLVLWREFEKFVPGTNFSAWGAQVALNQTLAHRKRKTRSRVVFSEQFLTAVAREMNVYGDDLDRRTAALAGCVVKLPSHHQELIRARYASGEAVEQIAEQLNRSTEAVYRMLSRIRQSLHECVTRTLAAETPHV